jgi:HlyD family secretion protein
LLPSSYADLVMKGKAFPFRPGMSASADIQTRTKQNVLSVALNAVTTRDKNGEATTKKEDKPADQAETKSTASTDDIEEVVFVLQKDNKVKKVKVKTGIQDINFIEVLDGLKDGDQVITGPYSIVSKTLKDGNLVTVVPKDKLFEDKKPK